MSNEIKQLMLDKVKHKALGNSTRCLKHLASDLVNEYGTSDKCMDDLVEMTGLCRHTIYNVANCHDDYSPQAETIERCIRALGQGIALYDVDILPEYQNKPKTARQRANAIYDDVEMQRPELTIAKAG